ncbi:glycosyltransferase family 2 protein [Fortiea sp. LEGE XX443]|uniref:glycosyltransferase n=1 Tax=Fortiea sp. LEGE XX443 TaxID=1828611 RepID=UPI00187E2827|nr:glycosyltransferase family 2 protein [Fortiea sp. LEGE XX443]MBE9007249.1 glycosyltransferase family 2 protein [Fortiea sp. LEGE XX443]
MEELTIFLSKSLLSWLAIQVCLALVFLFYLHLSQRSSLPDEQLPKTAVILSLRGADPFLSECLRSLLAQNYPQYNLKLVVDSQTDPAWQIAHDTVNQLGATNVELNYLRVIRHNCSLKCSALLQVVSELDNSYEVVAFVDGDTVVHPNWLRELVSPLSNPKIGATTGNRWYVPTGKYWGSLVRYAGNVSTVVQMFLFGIPWGGTLAVKTEVLRHTGMLEMWGKVLNEDLMMHKVLKKHGMQIKFVPSLIMVNREECDLLGLIDHLKRLFLYSRLYHPQWIAIVGDLVSSILFPTTAIVLLLISLWFEQWELTNQLFRSYSIYTLGLLLIMLMLELGIRPVIVAQGLPITKLSPGAVLKMAIAIPLTQWVYGLAMLSSLLRSTVKWRGAIYRVQGPWNIRLIEYQAYDFLDQPVDSKISL